MDFLEIVDTILLGPIKLIFETIFSVVNNRISNPGVSIICLSLAINLLVLPLYMRADVMQKNARDKEKKLHDGIAHIKKTFSGDERMMILQTYYRQNNYSPFSALQGSVSLLLQIPFFMAAVQVLSNIPALEGASLGPIADLSQPDALITIGGYSFNLLPILMTLINFISSALFSKDYPLKTKIQLYGLAIFFLVFLYNYPSGLVFYWLLNNVFSFVKTVFYKLKNPKKVLTVIAAVIGLALLVFACTMDFSHLLRIVLFAGLGLVLQIPWIVSVLSKKLNLFSQKYTPNKALFILGSLFLTVLTGILIPSAVIASSPQEFVDLELFYNPLWYIASSACLATGTFLIWLRIFYWLSNDKAKYFFDRIVFALCGVAIVNYMFFGTDFGTMTMSLKYEIEPSITMSQHIINLAIVCGVAFILYLISKIKLVKYVLLTAVLAFGVMSANNVINIQKSVNTLMQLDLGTKDDTYFELSKSGKNVVVLMLDRAMSVYVPYIMDEKPELKEQFRGFTSYSNTISFGGNTNSASPALLGGYEYTPVEMNKRDTESLASKHNEAHMVMPLIFAENNYKVTVSDPIYLDYNWVSDLSFFDDYPNITGIKTRRTFYNNSQKYIIFENNKRNFFCYSLTKSSPLLMQIIIYNYGDYNNTNDIVLVNQKLSGSLKASGYSNNFMSNYNVLSNLSSITKISDSDINTFLFMSNNTTHESTLLQLPDYTPQQEVDNSTFELAHKTVYQLDDGQALKMETVEQIKHYHVNMSSLIQIGEWLDYLRENGVYDNTRIIVVADHAYDLNQVDNLILKSNEKEIDTQPYFPLLLIKDFNSNEEFNISSEFMTNADVPTLATNGIIENPVNPFTGKQINSNEKFTHNQFIVQINYDTRFYNVEINNGDTFMATQWLSVKDDAWNMDNWTVYEGEMVLKEHAVIQN